jgi:AmiR/NasT family two-component response regulator
MKLILSAHVLVVDHDSQTRHETAEALRALGIQRVTEAGSVEDAEAAFEAERVDVTVVASERLDAPRWLDQPRQIPPAPGQDYRVPTILLLSTPARADIRAANAAGYEAVVALPLVARTLYRRIGSLMQRARRHERARAPAGYAGGPAMLATAAEAKE